MAEFKTLDEAAFKARGRHGKAALSRPHAVTARFDKLSGRVVVTLNTGIFFGIDPRDVPGLATATPEELSGVSVEGLGSGLHFPALDADFSVVGLLEPFVGQLDWARRESRALASRRNGKLGGRPRREAQEPVA